MLTNVSAYRRLRATCKYDATPVKVFVKEMFFGSGQFLCHRLHVPSTSQPVAKSGQFYGRLIADRFTTSRQRDKATLFNLSGDRLWKAG